MGHVAHGDASSSACGRCDERNVFQCSWVPPHELASRALHSTRLTAVVEEQQRVRAFSWRDALCVERRERGWGPREL